jgi:hypothetical protein
MKFLSILSGCIFVLVWSIVTWTAATDQRTDPDLGIATSRLPFWEAAVWSLPLSIAVWFTVVVVIKTIVWLVHVFSPSRRRRQLPEQGPD